MIPWRELSFGRSFTVRYFVRYWFLRLLPFPRARRIGAWLIARFVSFRQRADRRPVPSQPVLEILSALDRRGFAQLAPVLDAAQIDEMLAYLAGQLAHDGNRQLFATAQTRDALRARYDLQTIIGCPHVLRAINTPTVLSIAEGFLGCKPTITAIGLHWSFPNDRTPHDVQMFHRDCEAWQLLNMFVYLTDVDERSGPHRYVFGSHRTRGRLRMTPYAVEHVHDRYGAESVHTVIGPRGTTFVENGWGIHEGHPPLDKPRIMLSVMYSVGPVPIYDYQRVRVKRAHDHDKYINRLLVTG
jgi:hypothetical protein